MIMADPVARDYDLSSLRVVFTGGEALLYRPAYEFEKLTGATILQFYGSNETGSPVARRCTTHWSTELRTGGRIVADMAVRSSTVTPTSPTPAGSARLSRAGHQPRLPRWHRPRQAVHRRRLDAGWATSAKSTPTATCA